MRTVDANHIVKEIILLRDNIQEGRNKSSQLGMIRKALRVVEESPTIDAVKVVRCKNCIHRDLAGVPPFMYYYCKHDKGLSDVVRDDDYCPYGKEVD